MSGRARIQRYAELVRLTHKLATPDTLDALPPAVEKKVERLLEVVPVETHRLVRETLESLAPAAFPYHRIRRPPTTAREASSELEQMAASVPDDVEPLVDRALGILEEEGSATGPALEALRIVLDDPTSTTDEHVAATDRLDDFRPTLSMSAAGAATLARHEVVDFHDRYGALHEEEDPFWQTREGIVTYREPSLEALVSTPYEPLSVSLRSDQPIDDLVELGYKALPPASGFSFEVERSVEVALAATRIVRSFVDPSLVGGTEITFVFLDDKNDEADYHPGTGEIRVSTGRFSPYLVVHELGHALDHHVAKTLRLSSTFASESPGHPFSAYARIARPLFLPIIAAVARDEVRTELGLVLPEDEWKKLCVEPRPIREVLVAAGFGEDEAVALAADVDDPALRRVDDGSFDVELLEARDGVTFDPTRRRALEVLLGMTHDGLVDPSVRYEALARWMSMPAEVFARSFDQVIRRLARRKGLGFGPVRWPGDLPDEIMDKLEPGFLRALDEAKVLDETARQEAAATYGIADVGMSGVMAVVSLLAAMGVKVQDAPHLVNAIARNA